MGEPETTILVVEDEESFVEALTVGLKREGFRVIVGRDGAEALSLFNAVRPDLVLLDVMLPKISGIDVCREIRTHSPRADHHGDRQDLRDRHGRRASRWAPTTTSRSPTACASWWPASAPPSGAPRATSPRPSATVLEVGDVRLDPESHEVFVRGDLVTLPLKEFELLEVLLDNAGRVVTRDSLIDRVWGPHYVGDTKTLDVHVKRLRVEDRGGPVDAAPHRHHPRARLQVRDVEVAGRPGWLTRHLRRRPPPPRRDDDERRGEDVVVTALPRQACRAAACDSAKGSSWSACARRAAASSAHEAPPSSGDSSGAASSGGGARSPSAAGDDGAGAAS